MKRVPPAPSRRPVDRHSALARAALIGVGLGIGLFAGTLVGVLLAAAASPPLPIRLVALLFLGIALYGFWLAWRGIRGTSVRRLEGGESFLGRYALVFLVLVGALGLVLRAPRPFTADWVVTVGLLMLPIHVGLHELGHVAAGRLMGMRFENLGIGPFVATRVQGRLRWAWRGAALHPGVDGWASMSGGPSSQQRLRRAVFIAGGPLGNFATAVLAMALRNVLPDPTGLAAALLESMTVFGWGMGASNLIPIRLAHVSFVTDGASLLALLRPDTSAPARGP